MSSTPEFNAQQLAAARAVTSHQDGNAIVTLEDMRPYVYEHGLLLFAPRAQQLAAPAVSLVEATLGTPNAEPTLAQTRTARSLVARLVGEGNALPLNLFGEPGDAPDFVASAQVFSFVYTLRGDKNWKKSPETSPLGTKIYDLLGEKGAMTASELASELGRELTENAVQRALIELWTNLRVIPLYDQGDGPTLWEPTVRRFTKAIKAGVNAGQPTALSALISLYLGQVLLASEEEIEVFLSPLAARSRTREVIHALRTARQLDIVVLDGKSLLFVPGTLPQFPAMEAPVAEVAEGEEAPEATLEGEGRIKRFQSSREERPRREFKGKPSFGSDRKPSFGRSERKPAFGAKSDRERRPFNRSAREESPSFTRPWDEEKKARTPRRDSEDGERKPFSRDRAPREGGFKKFDGPRKPYVRREEGDGEERRPRASFGAKKSFGDRKPFGAKRTFGDKPARSFDGPKRPYARREEGEGGERKPRASFGAKKSFGDRPARNFDGPKRPYVRRDDAGAGDRPSRPSFGAKRTFGDKPARSFDRPKRSFGGEREGGEKPFRKFDAPKRPYKPREEGDGDRPARRSFGGDRPKAPFRSASGDGPKSRGGFGAKKPGGFKKDGPGGFKKAGSFGKKPGGFSRSAGDKVPFGSKPPRGVNPRTAGRASGGPKVSFPRKRKSESEE